jgi:hypothetical protein
MLLENDILEKSVILNDNLRRVLQMRNSDIKFGVLVNLVLCNQFDHYYDKENDIIRHFMLRDKFKKYLIRENKYIGETYSREGVMLLLLDFVVPKKIHIII